MSAVPLAICGQARELVEACKTSAEVGVLLDIKPGTVREWKRRYMSYSPQGSDWPCNDDLEVEQLHVSTSAS